MPTSTCPGRDATRAENAIRDYSVLHRARSRVTCSALVALLTDEERYVDVALARTVGQKYAYTECG